MQRVSLLPGCNRVAVHWFQDVLFGFPPINILRDFTFGFSSSFMNPESYLKIV